MLRHRLSSSLLLTSLVIFCLAVPQSIRAQPQLQENVVGSGGTNASSSSYLVDATVGQPAVGQTASTSFELEAGFWHGGVAGAGDANLTLWDGRNGESYSPPSPSPGTNNNPVGRFKLDADASGASLHNVTVSNYAVTPSGVNSIEVWTSTDNTFDSGDSEVASKSYADNVTFSGLSVSIPTSSVYVFVVVDLASDASGDHEPAIQSDTEIDFTDGSLAQVNGTKTTSFSDAYLSSGSVALPVQLASFEGEVSGEGVQLAWRTVSERNNADFHVQRQGRGTGSESGWTTVGERDGAGTTSEPRSYRFADKDLPYAADSLAYRLKQVDADGTGTLSEEIVIARTVDHLDLKKTFPNPARDHVTVRYAVPEETVEEGTVALHLYDVLGREVRTVRNDKKGGRHEMQMNVQDLASGTYFLRLTAPGAAQTHRLTVVR